MLSVKLRHFLEYLNFKFKWWYCFFKLSVLAIVLHDRINFIIAEQEMNA